MSGSDILKWRKPTLSLWLTQLLNPAPIMYYFPLSAQIKRNVWKGALYHNVPMCGVFKMYNLWLQQLLVVIRKHFVAATHTNTTSTLQHPTDPKRNKSKGFKGTHWVHPKSFFFLYIFPSSLLQLEAFPSALGSEQRYLRSHDCSRPEKLSTERQDVKSGPSSATFKWDGRPLLIWGFRKGYAIPFETHFHASLCIPSGRD